MSTLTDKSLGNRTEMADSDVKRLMMKRWAAWPRAPGGWQGDRRRRAGAVVVWALFVPAPDWLARHDVGAATAAAAPDGEGCRAGTTADARRGPVCRRGAGLHCLQLPACPAKVRLPTAIPRPSNNSAPTTSACGSAASTDWSASPAIRKRPPDRDGDNHRIYPRALTRAAAAHVRRQGTTQTRSTFRPLSTWSGAGR